MKQQTARPGAERGLGAPPAHLTAIQADIWGELAASMPLYGRPGDHKAEFERLVVLVEALRSRQLEGIGIDELLDLLDKFRGGLWVDREKICT